MDIQKKDELQEDELQEDELQEDDLKFIGHDYDDIGRIYKFKRKNGENSGDRFYSVTTVLSATKDNTSLNEWKESVGHKEAERQCEYASNIGTQVHLCLEQYLNLELSSFPNVFIKNLVKQITPYLQKNVKKVIHTEKVLYSKKVKLAGTTDAIVEYGDGSLYVLDFKTAKKQKPYQYIEDYFIQLAIYALMYEEMYNIPIHNGVLLFCYKEQRTGQREFKVNLNKFKQLVYYRIKKFYQIINNKQSE